MGSLGEAPSYQIRLRTPWDEGKGANETTTSLPGGTTGGPGGPGGPVGPGVPGNPGDVTGSGDGTGSGNTTGNGLAM